MEKKTKIAAVIYLAWQISFSIVVSPLVLGLLTAEQMGFTLVTLPMGLLIGALILGIIAAAGRWTSGRNANHIVILSSREGGRIAGTRQHRRHVKVNAVIDANSVRHQPSP